MTKVLNRTVGIADLASGLAEEQEISKVQRIHLNLWKGPVICQIY